MQHFFPMVQCGEDPARIFKTMAEDSLIFLSTSTSDNTVTTPAVIRADAGVKRCLSFSSDKDVSTQEEQETANKHLTLQSVPDESLSCRLSAEPLSAQTGDTCLNAKNAISVKVQHHNPDSAEDKENAALPSTTITQGNSQEEDTSDQGCIQDSTETASKQHANTEDRDSEVLRKARDEGRVDVVFTGPVTQEGCCRFVSEILKCVLYQRQQLPMTYDQLVYSQKKQQASVQDRDTVSRWPVQSADIDWRKCQQTLQELEEVLQQLEVLFSLSKVPRVLLLMGGSPVLPKELYEINMEDLILAGGDQCLRVSSCLRQLFRTLFVADLLSDTRPVRLMPTTVLVLAHRDCGVSWFRPKLQFKVPTRVKNQIIALSTDPSVCKEPRAEGSDGQDYVWFQAPMTIKGFSK